MIPSLWVRPVIGLGVVYFTVMVARITLGLTLFPDIAWFTSWISSSLHLVLATQVMMIGAYQHRKLKAQAPR